MKYPHRPRGRDFKPTPEQRAMVATLAGLKCTWEELRALVLHQDTGLPITKGTLHKHFKHELANGGARVKALIGQKFVEAVQRGEPWALRLGMRNRYGWVGAEGNQPLPEIMGSFADSPEIKITFVPGPGKPEFDITPPKPAPQPNPYSNAAPDLSRPAPSRGHGRATRPTPVLSSNSRESSRHRYLTGAGRGVGCVRPPSHAPVLISEACRDPIRAAGSCR
jgi:hypothetical protein